MNSRERMRIAMARGVPDRVPVMCQLALGHYFLHGGEDGIDIWHDSDAFARALVRLQRRYRFDGILVNLPGRDPGWRRSIDRIEQDGHARRIRWRDGMTTLVPDDDNPHVFGRDGAPCRLRFDELDPELLFYVEPHDLSGITWPYSWGFAGEPAEAGGRAFFPPWQCDTLRRVRECTAGAVSVHAEVFSPFSQLMELLAHTDCLMALVLDPGKVEAALDRLADGALCLALLYADTGCDAILISSAFTGAGLVSRAHYARFELPYLRRIVRGIGACHPDLPVYVHTCGAIADRLDLIAETGVDGIDTLDPPPIGTVDLRAAVAQLGRRVFIKGNVDPVHEVLECAPEATLAAARERVAIAGPGGAYVLSTACSVPPHAEPRNIEQLAVAAAETAGRWQVAESRG